MPTTTTAELWNVRQVAGRLGCSWRHVLRLCDRGVMPAGLKLGALRRWDAATIEAWIAEGCPKVRNAKGVGR